MRLLGTETEYGMFVEGKDPSQHVDEAAALVRCYAGAHATGWDYRCEDARRDARGYRVDHLSTDPEDARYDRADAAQRSQAEIRSDRVLTNGARLYNDHGHPEYATPECLDPRELAIHDRAGERVVLECARIRAERLGLPVRIYKNNTDFHGMSYGTHENYLMARRVPFEQIVTALLPFFVTRQIYAGAGKVGTEPRSEGPGTFQLSQRADFFTEEASVDTLHRRPIINTRDEPHADPRTHRRLHVICGDANMSPYATWLKVGTTALVLNLIEAGWQPPVRVFRPVEAIRSVSRDPSRRWLVETSGGTMSAVEIQHMYLSECERLGVGDDGCVGDSSASDAHTPTPPHFHTLLQEWGNVLNALECDPASLQDRLDWVAKWQLLETYREAEGLSWNDDALRSLDLEYHNVDPEEGLYYALEAEGAMRSWISEAEVAQAMVCPPEHTRAAVRGACVRKFGSDIRSITWTRLVVGAGSEAVSLDLADLVDGQAAGMAAAIDGIASASELMRLVE